MPSQPPPGSPPRSRQLTATDPDACKRCGKAHLLRGTSRASCSGHRRDGDPCGQPCLPDQRVCKLHGGMSPNALAGAARRHRERVAALAVETYGLPRDVMPADALLEEVHRTAGHVSWLEGMVRSLEPEGLTWGTSIAVDRQASEFPGEDVTQAAGISPWLELYHRERKHLVGVCAAALKAGIEERRVRLAESDGLLMGSLVKAILGRLALTEAQQDLVAVVVPEEFRRVIDQAGQPQLARRGG